MPSIRQTIIVKMSDNNKLFSPTLMMNWPKVFAAPVRVSVPITTPITAQATPTGSAALPPSASASLQDNKVSLPPRKIKFIETRIDIEITITLIPISKNSLGITFHKLCEYWKKNEWKSTTGKSVMNQDKVKNLVGNSLNLFIENILSQKRFTP